MLSGDTICDKAPKDHTKHNITLNLATTLATEEKCLIFCCHKYSLSRSQGPWGLRCGFAATRLLGLWVRIPSEAWKFLCCECCVLWGRGLCDKLITRPEESYRMCCVVLCNPEISWKRRPWPTEGCRAKNNKQTNKHKYSLNKRTKLLLGATITTPNVVIKFCMTVSLQNTRNFFQGAFLCQR